MTNKEALESLMDNAENGYVDIEEVKFVFAEMQSNSDEDRKWISITTRPLTDEEKEIHGEWEFMYDCSLPESGQDVLITDCYGNVEVDSFYNDGEYGCYFENNCDDGEVIAWMPLPEPYKAESEDKDADCD